MGSGKTAVGKALAKALHFTFIDLDAYIVDKECMEISEIFATKGEIYFRKIENQYLKEVLSIKNNIVLSTGGGTPCYGTNLEIINSTTNFSVYLSASIPTLTERLIKEKAKRPLIANLNDEELPEFIGKHLFERATYYTQAKATVPVNNKTVSQIVEEIVCKLY